MASFRVEYTFDDEAGVEINNSGIKFWKGTGLPDFEGDLECFALEYPKYMNILVKQRIILKAE